MRVISFAFLFSLFALNVFGDESGNYFNDAMYRYQSGHFETAVQSLKLAIQADPQNWKAHQLLGYSYYKLKDEAGALEECQKSLGLHGDNSRLELFVGRLKLPELEAFVKNDESAFQEGSEEAQMPPPPDEGPKRSLDIPDASKKEVQAPSTARETYFLKTGSGLFLDQYFFMNYYNRPIVNGVSTEIDEWTNFSGFVASLAGGIDFPDHFSIFLSADWMTRDFSLMANAQFTSSKWGWIEPYFYGGLGMDYFKKASSGPALQLGAGMGIPLTQDFAAFVELKVFCGISFWESELNPQLNYTSGDIYIPLLMGVKSRL